jgi:metal-responsive CopG/Arc/MetJ family transcriptional regulator
MKPSLKEFISRNRQLSVYIPHDMMDKLELVAKKNKITRTEMIRRILKKELK